MSHSRKTLTIATIFVLAPILSPGPAYACFCKISDNFSPLPPCEANDVALHRRIQQSTTQLMGKIATVSMQIAVAQQEVREWQRAQALLEKYRERMLSHYGDLIANPLPSMIAVFNANAPLARFVQLSDNGRWVVTMDPIDLRELADEFLDKLADPAYAADMYFRGLPTRFEDTVTDEYAFYRQGIKNRAGELVEYERYFEVVADSLRATGDSLAVRYTGSTTSDGLSEARIARLSATLSRLRGTSIEAEAKALQARGQAVNTSLGRSERLRRTYSETHPYIY